MKLLALLIIEGKKGLILHAEYELSSFGFFQRSSAKEFMTYLSKVVAERTPNGQRQCVEQDSTEYKISVMTQNDLSGAVVSDKEYPTRVAYSLINKFLEEFIVKHPNWRNSISTTNGTSASSSSSTNIPMSTLVFPELNMYLKKFQNPQEADSILRVQKELDETKEVLHKTIESVLRRGEKLDELIEKSNDLSAHSKTLYQVSRKRGCCG